MLEHQNIKANTPKLRQDSVVSATNEIRVKGNYSNQVSGDSVRWDDVDGSADGAVAAVGREDDDRRNAGLQRAVEVSEALKQEFKKLLSHA